MRYLILLVLLIILISGCSRTYYRPPAYPVPAQAPVYTTSVQTTTSSTTSIFDCKSCQQGYICRNNQCIKVEFSNTGESGSGSGSSSY